MKSKKSSQPVMEKYGLIEALESRIAPAGATASTGGLLDHAVPITASAGGAIRVTAGEVLTTGANGGGIYLLYVQQGAVLVHTTDLNNNQQLDFNEITGLSVANGTKVDVFVDIHGDVVTDLNSDFTLTDSDNNANTGPAGTSGRDGRVLLDANINAINLRSLQPSDFSPSTTETSAQIVNDHLAMSSYSIYGNIYAGGGLGTATDPTSGLHINTNGASLQAAKYPGGTGGELYAATQPTIGSIYVGTAASGQQFSFGTTGTATDIYGSIIPFTPAPGEAGASVYNISSTSAFNIGNIEGGNGGFNGGGGSLVNIALQGNEGGGYSLIAGNAGTGTTGHAGGSILHFSEAGTFTGQVLLESGNGGTALTGVGGNAGSIPFNTSGTINVNAHFVIQLGNGGNGYSGGGNGGSVPQGHFVTPEGVLTNATDYVGTMHTIGSIGTTTSFDFNGDGYSDGVFATKNPNQVEVIFGTSDGFGDFGFDATKTIYLNSPSNVSSIVVGDFNGDGHPDIAVASGDANFGGVEIFLSQYNSHGGFTGFSSPSFVPLPALGNQGLYYTSVPVTKLAAGDFNGDGTLDLALIAKETDTVGNEVTTLIFLNGDGHGHFFADFTNNAGGPDVTLHLNDNPTAYLIKPTALTSFAPGSGHDVIIQSSVGSKGATIFDETTAISPGGIGFGKVDTNRAAGPNNISSVDFQVLDFTVTQDPTTPTTADVIALSQTPVGFLVSELGTGTGGFTIESGSGDQAGFAIATNSHPVAIVTVPDAALMAYSDVAVLDYGTSPDDTVTAFTVAAGLTSVTKSITWLASTPGGQNDALVAFDTYDPHPVQTGAVINSGPYEYGFAVGEPLTSWFTGDQGFSIQQPGGGTLFFGEELVPTFKNAGYFITAGTGGNALDGVGGHGGSIGQSLTTTTNGGVVTASGSLSFLYPADVTFEGLTTLTAGNGGNGFSGGGAGGNIFGLSVAYNNATLLTGVVSLQGGNGGQSLGGSGGAGGSIGQTFIITGEDFVAGNGGVGVNGGAGGSVQGTKIAGLATIVGNSVNGYVHALGGQGATGLTQGGNGGNVDSFQVQFPPLEGGTGGELLYVGGNAGNAVAGHGGAGGAVINSSPLNTSSETNGGDNHLAGDIVLNGGTGGDGLYGGAGGGILNFVDNPSVLELPTSLTVIAGNGGHATVGTGGAGGSVVNFSAPSTGDGFIFYQGVFSSYDRVVAGFGGDSVGGAGGAGGSVTGLNSTAAASDAQFFVAGGAGGDGLTAGGHGGSVLSSTVNAGATTGKVVVVAGDGGNSFSVAPLDPKNPMDITFAVGGVNGPGGNGGSINDFVQPGSIGTHVDLIAGNGGDTVAHSVAGGQVTKDNSGQGGSILNVNIAGDIGNISPTVAIKSYNDFFGGQTMQQFIETAVIGIGFTDPLTDAVGNVGLVAGAAGRVQGDLPSENGINGSVSNVHARDIMSMVAGSVDRVDFIQKLTNYGSTINGGVLGADKSVPNGDIAAGGQNFAAANQFDYISQQGLHTSTPLPGGGTLIDGAFMAKNIRQLLSSRDFPGTLSE